MYDNGMSCLTLPLEKEIEGIPYFFSIEGAEMFTCLMSEYLTPANPVSHILSHSLNQCLGEVTGYHIVIATSIHITFASMAKLGEPQNFKKRKAYTGGRVMGGLVSASIFGLQCLDFDILRAAS